MCSYDVYGVCETHAILLGVKQGIGAENASTVIDLDPYVRKNKT